MRREQRINPDAKTLAGQLVIGVATSVLSGVLVAMILESIRERREREPMSDEPAPGYGQTHA